MRRYWAPLSLRRSPSLKRTTNPSSVAGKRRACSTRSENDKRAVHLFEHFKRQIGYCPAAFADVEEFRKWSCKQSLVTQVHDQAARQQRKVVPTVVVDAPLRIDVQTTAFRAVPPCDIAG